MWIVDFVKVLIPLSVKQFFILLATRTKFGSKLDVTHDMSVALSTTEPKIEKPVAYLTGVRDAKVNVKTWRIFQCRILFVFRRLWVFALFIMFSGYFGTSAC